MKKLFSKLKNQIADNSGMSFIELLVAVLILMLVSTGMVSVVGFGANQYDKTIRESEALVLCSTISTILEHELSYTTDVRVDESGNVSSFLSSNYAIEGSLSSIMTDNSGVDGYGKILLGNQYDPGEYRELLGQAAYSHDLLAKVENVTYDAVTRYFTLTVLVGYEGEEIASRTFQVKRMNE